MPSSAHPWQQEPFPNTHGPDTHGPYTRYPGGLKPLACPHCRARKPRVAPTAQHLPLRNPTSRPHTSTGDPVNLLLRFPQLSTPGRVPRSPGALWLLGTSPSPPPLLVQGCEEGSAPRCFLPTLLFLSPPCSSRGFSPPFLPAAACSSPAQSAAQPRPPPGRSSVPGSWDPLGIRRGSSLWGADKIRMGKGEGGDSGEAARLPFPLRRREGGEGNQENRQKHPRSLRAVGLRVRAGLGVPCLHLLLAGHRLPAGEIWGGGNFGGTSVGKALTSFPGSCPTACPARAGMRCRAPAGMSHCPGDRMRSAPPTVPSPPKEKIQPQLLLMVIIEAPW